MMYFLLILFFSSLIAIVLMIGRKLVLLKNGKLNMPTETSFEVPYIKETKDFAVENIKKYEHIGLVFIVKSYMQFSAFLKNKYEETKTKIKNIHLERYPNGELRKKIEASEFYKFILVYKQKIRDITHKIKEEENNSQM